MSEEVKKIFYIATVRLPTEKAHGLQIVQTCAAFKQNGVEVELVIPKRQNAISATPFAYYGLPANFTVTTLPSLDLVNIPKIGFWLTSRLFFSKIKNYLKNTKEVLYTRDHLIAAQLANKGYRYFFEIHSLPNELNAAWQKAVVGARGIVVISQGLKNELVKRNVFESKILVAHDAVDVSAYKTLDVSKKTWRETLNIPLDKKIILYTGHLYEWKGAATLAEAAKLLPNVDFYFVGGTANDNNNFRNTYIRFPNICVIPFQPHEKMPVWQSAADVLVLPNSGKEKISSYYTSPLKLFEYMASGRPIIASNLPSIKEVLTDDTATFFNPDNATSLAEAITWVLSNTENAQIKAAKARENVKQYNWNARAKKIIDFISSHNENS